MSIKQYEEDGFGKLGDRGRYGGIVTHINTLPVGTEFHVANGAWDGTIVEIDGVKYLDIDGGSNVNLEKNKEVVLDIYDVKKTP